MPAQATLSSGNTHLDLTDHVQTIVHEVFEEYEDGKVQFIRVEVTNVNPAIESIIEAIADTSWVTELADPFDRASLLARAQPTIDKLSTDLMQAINNTAAQSVGEYIVSMVARHIIEAACGHKALPLAEVIKEQITGNPGFDYHHEHANLILLFGEAKYKTGYNAYGDAFSQIVDHIKMQKDVKEIADLSDFLSGETKTNFLAGKKGYSAAFSTSRKSFDTNRLINNVRANADFVKLLEHNSLIIVAVDIND